MSNTVLESIRSVVSADTVAWTTVSFNELIRIGKKEDVLAPLHKHWSVEPPLSPALLEKLSQQAIALFKQQAVFTFCLGRLYEKVWIISELISEETLNSMPMYQEIFKPLGLRYFLLFATPSPTQIQSDGNPVLIENAAITIDDLDQWTLTLFARRDLDFSFQEKKLVEMTCEQIINHWLRPKKIKPDPDLLIAHFNLTPRQSQVLNLLLQGNTDKKIGLKLNIKPHAVSKHLEDIREKVYPEIAVFKRAIKGMSQQEIAAELRLPPNSVLEYWQNMCDKLNTLDNAKDFSNPTIANILKLGFFEAMKDDAIAKKLNIGIEEIKKRRDILSDEFKSCEFSSPSRGKVVSDALKSIEYVYGRVSL